MVQEVTETAPPCSWLYCTTVLGGGERNAGTQWLLLSFCAVQDPNPKKGADYFRVGLCTSVSLTRIIPRRHGHGLTESGPFSWVCLWTCILSDSGTCTVDSAGCCTGVSYSQAPPLSGAPGCFRDCICHAHNKMSLRLKNLLERTAS